MEAPQKRPITTLVNQGDFLELPFFGSFTRARCAGLV